MFLFPLLAVGIAGLVVMLGAPRASPRQARIRAAVAAMALAAAATLLMEGVHIVVRAFPWVVLVVAIAIGWVAPSFFFKKERGG